jgi:hypothetical protein
MTIKFDTTHADELNSLNAYELARIADCGDPDTLDSDGAEFLKSIRDDVVETFENDNWSADTYATIWGIADSNVPVMTHDIAKAFVDLCAYNEDVSDYVTDGGTDLVRNMKVALYVIGERLAGALLEEYRHTLEELEDVA